MSAKFPRKGTGLGFWAGMGLVLSDTIGSGIFLSTSLIAQNYSLSQALLLWIGGAVVALLGCVGYGALVQLLPGSGGEYRYLSELGHPILGFAAGWVSVLVGFAAPIAIDALACGQLLYALVGAGLSAKVWAAVLVLTFVLWHSVSLGVSRTVQHALVILKFALVFGFALFGLLCGSNQVPTFGPQDLLTLRPGAALADSALLVFFAFSGWNAATYVAQEFENPKVQVRRAMFYGCILVSVVYLCITWVMLSNIDSAMFGASTQTIDNGSIAHLVAKKIFGAIGGTFMSVLLLVVFLSAMSALTYLGPRIIVAMADDRVVPLVFRANTKKPPVYAILFLGAVAELLVFTHSLREMIENVAGVLILFSALSVMMLFRQKAKLPNRAYLLTAGALYALSVLVILGLEIRASATLSFWIIAVLGLGAFFFALKTKQSEKTGLSGQ